MTNILPVNYKFHISRAVDMRLEYYIIPQNKQMISSPKFTYPPPHSMSIYADDASGGATGFRRQIAERRHYASLDGQAEELAFTAVDFLAALFLIIDFDC